MAPNRSFCGTKAEEAGKGVTGLELRGIVERYMGDSRQREPAMRGIAGLAVTGMILVLAAPATARDRSGVGGEARSFGTAPAKSRSALAPQIIELDERAITPSVDPSGPRLFGSVPVAENVALGVGLFSVVGTTEKEQIRRRLDPSRAMLGSSDTRVAAVGMSLRF
jgi:hypothetical protein